MPVLNGFKSDDQKLNIAIVGGGLVNYNLCKEFYKKVSITSELIFLLEIYIEQK